MSLTHITEATKQLWDSMSMTQRYEMADTMGLLGTPDITIMAWDDLPDSAKGRLNNAVHHCHTSHPDYQPLRA